MTTLFDVHGPFAYPGRKFRAPDVRAFWSEHSDLKPLRGCYLFGIRSGPGALTPGYVGRTRRSFEKEVFNAHQQRRYYEFLQDHPKGTPVFIFVVLPRKRGKPNAKHIGELEKFLIQTAVAVNPELTNVQHGTHVPQWGIRGVLRDGAGRPAASAQALKSMLNLKKSARGGRPGRAARKKSKAPPRPRPNARVKRMPAPGTELVREYKGETIRVRVTESGFRWNGTEFSSLSALAASITGASSINGRKWFRL